MSRGQSIALGTKCIDTALAVLEEGLTARQDQRVADIAAALDIPVATAYRHLAALKRHGLIRRTSDGRFVPGAFLLALFDRSAFNALLTETARPILARLAAGMHVTSHLGVLEANMVTYLIKVQGSDDSPFSREDSQLDAYCSGLGKLLLAWLPADQLDAYLTEGELVPLTRNTIVDVRRLRQELFKIRRQGFSIDDGEFDEELFCLAVPILSADGRVVAALSISTRCRSLIAERRQETYRVLAASAAEISQRLYTDSARGSSDDETSTADGNDPGADPAPWSTPLQIRQVSESGAERQGRTGAKYP